MFVVQSSVQRCHHREHRSGVFGGWLCSAWTYAGIWSGKDCSCVRYPWTCLSKCAQAIVRPCATCTIPVLREHGPPDALPLVNSCLHLGVIQSADGGIRLELNQRIGAAWSAFREVRRKVFRSKRISVDKKAVYLQGPVMAKLTVGAGAWPPLKEGEARAFQGCVINMYRQLLCLPTEMSRHLYGASVCAQVGLSSPSVIFSPPGSKWT